MPRTSKDALSVITSLPGQRLDPPARLAADAAEIWRDIASSKPHDWFTVENRDLLEALCVAIVAHRSVAAQLKRMTVRKLGTDEGLARFDKLTRIADRQARVMSSVATKLRLTNQSRYTPSAAATATKRAKGARPWDA